MKQSYLELAYFYERAGLIRWANELRAMAVSL